MSVIAFLVMGGVCIWLVFEALLFVRALLRARSVVLTSQYVTLAGLQHDWHVVHLSDLHINGGNPGKRDVRRLRQTIAELREHLQAVGADSSRTVVCITGDLVVEQIALMQSATDLSTLADCLFEIRSLPAHHFFVVGGNHDKLYTKRKQLWWLCRRLGFVVGGVTRHKRVFVSGIQQQRFTAELEVLLTPDYTCQKKWYHNPQRVARRCAGQRVTQVLGQAPAQLPARLWLTHSAAIVDYCKTAVWPQLHNTLLLAGHTHGGQLAPTGLIGRVLHAIAIVLLKCPSSRILGMSQVGASGFVHVSPGFGHGYSHLLRTVVSSVTVVRLMAQDNKS